MNNEVILEKEDLKRAGFGDSEAIVVFVVEKLKELNASLRSLHMQKKGSYYGDYMQFFAEFDDNVGFEAEHAMYTEVSRVAFEVFKKDAYFDTVGSASFAEVEKDVVRVWEH